jgi:hypothetical protein
MPSWILCTVSGVMLNAVGGRDLLWEFGSAMYGSAFNSAIFMRVYLFRRLLLNATHIALEPVTGSPMRTHHNEWSWF